MEQSDYLIFGAALCAMGGFAIFMSIVGWRKGKAIQHWPSTTGTITESTTAWNYGRISTVAPKLSYAYTVAGREYTGHDIAVTEVDTASERDALDKIAPYPLGKEVTVYYDPDKPGDAVLEKSTGGALEGVFGFFGLVLVTVGVVMMLHVKGGW
jgi:hypothetical protein